MGRLILIRHGQTDKNLNNTLHTRNDNEALNATGIAQIRQTAQKLKKMFPDIIFSSHERRAVESAEILSRELKVPMEKIEGMQEWNMGIYTGRSREEMKKILGPMTPEERYEYIPPKGESWRAFETRLTAAIKKIVEDNKDKTIAVVTHGGAINALMQFLLNTPKEESYKNIPGNASLTMFDFDGKNFHQITINDASRLS